MQYSQLDFLIPAENIGKIKSGDTFYFRKSEDQSIHGKIKEMSIMPNDFKKRAFYRMVGQVDTPLTSMAVEHLNSQVSLNVQEEKTSYLSYFIKKLRGEK